MSEAQEAGAGSPAPAAGVWIDTDTGELVRTEPQHGRQLVVPGDPIPESVQVQLDAVTAPAAPAEEVALEHTPAVPAEDPPPAKSPAKRRTPRKVAD